MSDRLKKWIFFTIIGCVAYFVGYIWGQQYLQGPSPTASPPSLQNPAP